MRTIRLKNFRSFEDTGTIELRPLVVLVGANNAGKSSFLRFFPLLRQTFEAPPPPASPLLWYAKGGYVDFGDFSGAVRRGAVPREIVAEFEHIEVLRYSGPPYVERVPLTLSVSFREVDGKTRTAAWSILGDGVSCTLDFMSPTRPGTLFARTGADIVLDKTLDHISDYYANAFVPYYQVLDFKDLPDGGRLLHADRSFEDLAKEIGTISSGLVQEEDAKALATQVVMFGDRSGLEGEPAAKLRKAAEELAGKAICDFYVLSCHEIENLLPRQLVLECLSAEDHPDLSKRCETLAALGLLGAGLPLDRLDLKRGLRGHDIARIAPGHPKQRFLARVFADYRERVPTPPGGWCDEALGCEQRERSHCRCVLFGGLGDGMLARVARRFEGVSAQKVAEYLFVDGAAHEPAWSEIGRLLFSWGCSYRPMRA